MTVALPDPSCNAGIVSYRLGKTDALLFTNAASTRRENLTLKMSFDEGATWPVQRAINPGPSGILDRHRARRRLHRRPL
ncbi:MAG TPA: sialidase family protein [Terriglobales bacterium]|nr:sialidase family protein [Terriglobales bacterium]